MKTLMLCNAIQAATFRRESGLSAREAIWVQSPHVVQGIRLGEGDLILEWPGWRDVTYGSQQIVDELKMVIARGGNAGPEWVSSTVLTAT